ncbi:MAG TPA: glycosyltransferase family 4 protein, partial [Alphaproteobacteria bacterium]
MTQTETGKKILFISRPFPPPDKSATGLRLLELVQYLSQQGWDTTVLATQGRGGHPPQLSGKVKIERLSIGKSDKPAAWHHIFFLLGFVIRAFRLPKQDVIITLTDPPFLACVGAILKFFGRTDKLVHWCHDLYPDLFPVLGSKMPGFVIGLLTRINRAAMRAHDVIIAIGFDMAEHLVQTGIPPEKIHVIYNWPDVPEALLDIRTTSDAVLFANSGYFTVMYSGNFGQAHDFSILLDTMKLVQDNEHNEDGPIGQPVHFILAGDGRQLQYVRDTAEQMGLTNVTFLKPQPTRRLADLLQSGEVHIATMKADAIGLLAPSKVNSALGLGKPVLFIGPSGSHHADLINEFHAGKVIDVTDPNAKFHMAEAILDYARDRAIFNKAKQGAREAAARVHFD